MTQTRNLWPAGIILAFALFITGTAGLIILACSHKEDLVSSDYYEKELRYQGHIERLNRTRQLPTPCSVSYEAAGKSIRISLPANHALLARGLIQLYRPSGAGMDRQFDLDLDSTGAQSIDASALRPGLWKVRVSWTVGKLEYFIDQKVVVRTREG